MEQLSYILGEPEYIDGVGDLFPVKLKEYDRFIRCSAPLLYSKAHFGEDVQSYSLLELLVLGLKDETLISSLELTFGMVLKKEIAFHVDRVSGSFSFLSEDGASIDLHNYDRIRSVIMRMNLLFEPRVYKNKLVQEWAIKAMQARAKNGIKLELEDMLSTISVYTGKHYWDLAEYTIYQLRHDFNRIGKLKEYETNIAFKCAGADIGGMDYFAESIDLFRNPYDDLFKSGKKLSKLDNSMK
jgi:hypothetical protein